MSINYNILWIDDQYKTDGAGFIDEASLSGFTLKAFTNSDEGMAYLEKNANEVDGIILDARVYKSADDEDPGRKGLSPSIRAIPKICERHRRGKVPPTVIYTGADEFQDDAEFAEEMNQMDIEVFKKNEPNELLFDYLKKQIAGAPAAVVRNRYQDIYQACNTGKIDMECWKLLRSVLLAIESNSPLPENHYNAIRIAVEYGLRFLHAYGILPPSLIPNDKVILQLSSIFLAGGVARFNQSGDSVTTHDGNPLLPKLIAEGLRFVLDTTQPASHSDTATNPKLPSIVAVENEVPEHHTLQTITYITVDFIQWCINFVSKNPDRAKNSNLWKELLPETATCDTETCDGEVNNFDDWENAYVKRGEGLDNVRIKAQLIDRTGNNLSIGQRVRVTHKSAPGRKYRECTEFELLE